MNAPGVTFAVIDLQKVTRFTTKFIKDDPCLGFRFDALNLHFGFSFPNEEPTDRSQAFL
jgi:hypothetical protein